jgi:hypothetical protein
MAPRVKRIPYGHAFEACYVIVNDGGAPSGPFNIVGSRLGMRHNPRQYEPSLAPGASRQHCLEYTNTPQPGAYTSQIQAATLDDALIIATTVSFIVVGPGGGKG